MTAGWFGRIRYFRIQSRQSATRGSSTDTSAELTQRDDAAASHWCTGRAGECATCRSECLLLFVRILDFLLFVLCFDGYRYHKGLVGPQLCWARQKDDGAHLARFIDNVERERERREESAHYQTNATAVPYAICRTSHSM